MNKQLEFLIVLAAMIAFIVVIVVAILIPLELLPLEDQTLFGRLFFGTGSLVIIATFSHIVACIRASPVTPSTEGAYWKCIDTFFYDSSWSMGCAALFCSVIGLLCAVALAFDKSMFIWMVVFGTCTFGSYIVAMILVAGICKRYFERLFYERNQDTLDSV